MKALTFTLLASLLTVAGAYTVQKGDTLYSLARAHNLKVEDLRRLNNLTSDNLVVGQQLRFSASEALPPNAPASPAPSSAPSGFTLTPPPPGASPAAPASVPSRAVVPDKSSPVIVKPGSTFEIGKVKVELPSVLSMGDGFVVKLTGEQAQNVVVRFPSELGEDVRQPNEALTPYGAAGVYLVPGRVVLGKTTPVIVELTLGSEVVRGIIPLRSRPGGPVVHLQLAPQVAQKLTDPGKAAEDALVNKAYLSRGLPRWTKPFTAPLSSAPIPGSFGQSRTYTPGSPVVYHYGADYLARAGTPIHAVNDGTVMIAGNYPTRGNFVMIDHGGGVTSLYFHQSKLLVKVGQQVKRGDVIGLVGSTGIAEGDHLHLEIRVRGEATEPAEWFNRLWP